MERESTQDKTVEPHEAEVDRPTQEQTSGPKKPFVKPELTRYESLPEVTKFSFRFQRRKLEREAGYNGK